MKIVMTILILFLFGCFETNDRCCSIVEYSPGARRFYEIFPDVTCKIKRFGGVGAPLSWKARSIVYDRYEICGYIGQLDSFKTIEKSDFVVYINEILSNIELNDNGKWISISRITLGQLSSDEFMMISSVDDLFMALNIDPIKDMPISNIEVLKTYW